MKSVVEESSSLTQAIENGWQRAGRPREFTVKILQEPKKNFFGFTTISAKVALLFNEARAESKRKDLPQKRRLQKKQEPIKKSTPEKKVLVKRTAPPKIWSDERVTFVQQWIRAMLNIMNRSNVTFQTSIDRSAIRFLFNEPLFKDNEKEKQLFRSWAYLIIQTVRHTYKQQFRNIKVVLKSSEQIKI